MKLLLEIDKKKFLEYTDIYQKNIFPYIKFFEEESKKNGYSEHLPPSIQRDVWRYCFVLQWPIRKLEYSFMLHNCKNLLKPGVKTLDAGCGITPIARFFASQGCEAYGIDSNENAINYLQNPHSLLYDPNVHLTTQDLTALKFEDNMFDLVTNISVLEHLDRVSASNAISEMLRVLRPGGMLILTVDFTGREKTRRLKSRLKLQFEAGLRLLKNGKIREFTKKLPKNVLPNLNEVPRGTYDPNSLMKYIVEPFRDHFEDKSIQKIKVNTKLIRQFWISHWQPAYHYDKNEGRNYVSVGIILKKQ